MATDQLSPEMRWSVPQVERLPLHDGELSELERGKKKSTTTSLDDPQQMIEGNVYKHKLELEYSFLFSFIFLLYILRTITRVRVYLFITLG